MWCEAPQISSEVSGADEIKPGKVEDSYIRGFARLNGADFLTPQDGSASESVQPESVASGHGFHSRFYALGDNAQRGDAVQDDLAFVFSQRCRRAISQFFQPVNSFVSSM